jgi:hypothetical protein
MARRLIADARHLIGSWGIGPGAWLVALLFALHLAFQAGEMLVVANDRLVIHSGHDGEVYAAMADDPWPQTPQFQLKRYRRLLYPVLLHALPLDRTVAMVSLGVLGVLSGAYLLWRVACYLGVENPATLSLMAFLLPWLFVAPHLGLLEPEMLALLIGGTLAWLRSRPWLASALFAMAVLTKETAAVSVLALGAASLLTEPNRRRAAVLMVAGAILPAGLAMVALGWYWHDPLWFLRADSFSLGGLFSAMARTSSLEQFGDQVINVVLIGLACVGVIRLLGISRLLGLQCALALPVVVLLQDWTVYGQAFDFGRSFAIIWPLLLTVPLGGRAGVLRAVPVVAACILLSTYWTLYFTKFFVENKIMPGQGA